MIQNPKSLTEQLLNLAERIAIELRTVVKTVGTKISKKDADTAYLGKTAKAASAKIADSATKATQDSNGNVIVNTYATKTELTNGLADKLATTGKAQTAGIADTANALSSSAKVPYSQITGTPSIPGISGLIPKTGDRGALAGYEQWFYTGATATLSVSSGDTLLIDAKGAAATINVQAGAVNQVATKLVWVALSNKSITINGSVGWFAGDVPTLNKANAVLLFFFHDNYTDCRLIGQWD